MSSVFNHLAAVSRWWQSLYTIWPLAYHFS